MAKGNKKIKDEIDNKLCWKIVFIIWGWIAWKILVVTHVK